MSGASGASGAGRASSGGPFLRSPPAARHQTVFIPQQLFAVRNKLTFFSTFSSSCFVSRAAVRPLEAPFQPGSQIELALLFMFIFGEDFFFPLLFHSAAAWRP